MQRRAIHHSRLQQHDEPPQLLGQYVGDNCTNYAAYLLGTVDGMSDRQPWPGTGYAYNWGVAESAITDRVPAVGAVAWWPAGHHGAGCSDTSHT